MADQESGIEMIEFIVSDTKLDTVVGNGTVQGQRVTNGGDRRKKRVSVADSIWSYPDM